MKRIEKEIKNKSIYLIESSLPGIESLDNIPEKPISARTCSMIFVPIGAAALLIAAILIPSIIKCSGVADPIKNNPIDSEMNPNNPIDDGTSNPIDKPTKHSYTFDLKNYTPTFENFNEVTYYSYLAYKEEVQNASKHILYAPDILDENDNVDIEDENESRDYVDSFGRYHYPLALDEVFTFSNFLYFEFESEGNAFLEERIGNGHIYALTVDVTGSFLQEGMIILKNNEKYYSCLTNGGHYDQLTGIQSTEFSAHKIIEGFDVIKDITNKRYITVYHTFTGTPVRIIPTNATSIKFENDVFPVIEESVYYDDVSVSCSIGEIRQLFGLNPDFEVSNYNIREDKLVYDVDVPETSQFTLEEFSEEFTVSNGDLYLGEDKLLSIDNATKIYVSDINKDSYRDIVFETYESSDPKIVVYDVYRNTYLCERLTKGIKDGFDYYLTMKDNKITFEIFVTGKTDDRYLVDYGYLAYSGHDGICLSWANYYEFGELALVNIYESDGVTLVESYGGHRHKIHEDTIYYIDLELGKYFGSTNTEYPEFDDPITCEMNSVNPNTFDLVTWRFVSLNNGVYRYEFSCNEQGRFAFILRFKGYNLRHYFDVDVDYEELIIDEDNI